jgi:isopentenyl-diphosphate delta-isomerase type 1
MVKNRPVYSRGAKGRKALKRTSEELLEIVDENDRVIGTEHRGVIHEKGLMHRSAQVLVFNARGDLFLQKRSLSKDEFPGLWDSSAAGHVDPGESYFDCARRELAEELGIDAGDTLQQLFRLKAQPDTGFEHCRVFTCLHEGPMTLQPGEVDAGRWVTPTEMDELDDDADAPLTPAVRRFWRMHKARNQDS